MRTIFSVDPGNVTGLVRATGVQSWTDIKFSMELGDVLSWEVDCREPHGGAALIAEEILTSLEDGEVDLVIEDFILRNRSMDRSMLSPVRVTSALLGILVHEDVMDRVNLTFQQPSQAKSIATNERLKRWGLWIVGSTHERDAMRHLIVYLRT